MSTMDYHVIKENQHDQFGIKIITIAQVGVFLLLIYDDDNNRLENNGLRKIR